MKVGILSQWFPPETGPASIPGVLAKGLVNRGHEVAVLTGFPNYPTGRVYDGCRMRLRQDIVNDGYKIRRVALYPDHSNRISGRVMNYGSFAASAAALGTAALKGIDVLWVYNSPATVALPMWVAKARFHAPIVLHNMDMWPDSVIHTGFAPKRGASVMLTGLNAWVHAMYRSADAIAYISESSGDELRRRGVPAAKLRYAPVWIDEEVYRPADATPPRAELGYTDKDIVVGYAGAIGHAQSVVQLAQAVASLSDPTPLRCLILGAGTEAAKISHIANNRPDRVKFLGQVTHDRMKTLSAVPDVSFVGLSTGGDASFAAPSKVHSIMACAKPIFAVASGHTAELVRRSGSPLISHPGDEAGLRRSMSALCAIGRDGLRDLGLQALALYRAEMSADVCMDRIMHALEDAANSQRSPSAGSPRKGNQKPQPGGRP